VKSQKIKTLNELQKTLHIIKRRGRKIGLITGCFDIIHIGHIKLFRFAKKHVDTLVVGLDNDKSIKLTKGQNRPIHDFRKRSETLSELTSIDYIFQIKAVFNHGSKDSEKYHSAIVNLLKPTHIITAPANDTFWKQKEERAKKFKIKFLKDQRKKNSSSTSIINALLKREF